MRDLLVATNNTGKLEEFLAFFKGSDFSLKTIKDVISESFDIEEVGSTFEGNALIKAFTCGKKTGLLTIADDSGVEIDALNGEPGVRSARYVEGSDKDRVQAVLNKMKHITDMNERTARFVSVIAIYDPATDRIRVTRGECAGSITMDPIGNRGFGYDPIFFVNALGKTYAEASLDEKSSVDHRGKALRRATELLKEFV